MGVHGMKVLTTMERRRSSGAVVLRAPSVHNGVREVAWEREREKESA